MRQRRSRVISGKNLVTFEVGGISYGLEVGRVREIVRPVQVLPLPHLPDGVIGVVDHRGDVVPILDLRKRFAAAQVGRDKDVRWIIATRGERLLGLAVDRVTDVFGVSESQRRELSDEGDAARPRGVKAAYAYRDQLVFVLDADELTSIAERIALPGEPAAQGSARG